MSAFRTWHLPRIGGVLVLLLAGTVFYLKREGIVHHVKTWRANSLLEKSREAGAKEDWEKADRLALAAWELHRGDYETLQQLFRMSLARRSPHLLAVAHAMANHPELTPEDRVGILRLYLAIGDHVNLSRQLKAVPKEQAESPEILEIIARFLLARNDPAKALGVLDRLRSMRAEPRDSLLAADALSRSDSDDGNARIEAQRIIDELFRPENPPDIALGAFALLGQIPPDQRDLTRFGDASERLDAIGKSHFVPPPLWLLETELEILSHPDRREELVARAVERWKTEAPQELGEWLLAMGETDVVLRIFSEENSPGHFQLLVRCRCMRNEWEEAAEMLSDPPPGMNSAVLHGLKAIVAEKRGNKSDAGAQWERALRQAELENGRGTLLRLAKLAASAGNAGIRNRAMTEALRRPTAIALPASDVDFVFSHLIDRDEGEALLKVTLGLLASEPDNPIVLNNVAWLGILCDHSTRVSTDQLKERFPSAAGFRTTWALSLLEAGQVEEALAALAPVAATRNEEGTAKMAGTDLALLALAWFRNGEEDRAASVLPEVNWEEMLTVERDFFKEALKDLPGRSAPPPAPAER